MLFLFKFSYSCAISDTVARPPGVFSRRSLLSLSAASSRSLFISSNCFSNSSLRFFSSSNSLAFKFTVSCASLVTSSGFLNLGDRANLFKSCFRPSEIWCFPASNAPPLASGFDVCVSTTPAAGVVCKTPFFIFSFLSTTSSVTRMHTCPTTFSRASSHIAIHFPGIFPLFSTTNS